jgi:cardiolipin synthase
VQTTIITIVFVLLEIVAIYFAFKAVANSRTPQGSVAWVVFLIAAPYAGIPAYLFLGNFRFKGYVIARQESEEVVEGVAEFAKTHLALGDDDVVGYPGFEKIAEAPIIGGNAVDLLIDGQQTFDAIFDAIDKAKIYVLAQFYIIKDDELGKVFQQRLIDCVGRGVKVRLLYDSVGCVKLPKSFLEILQQI